VDAVEKFGDMERGAGFFEYVIGHIYLRQTFLTAGSGGIRASLTEAADGAELSIQRYFKYRENGFFEIVVHGGLLSTG
jgi:hypothetical protein